MSPMRDVWANCHVAPNAPEILHIDLMQDGLMPLSDEGRHIRALITRLEACHYKYRHHILRIISAIGAGHTTASTPPTGLLSAREALCVNICNSLNAWCEDNSVTCRSIVAMDAEALYKLLGAKTPLKIWQVQRVCDKLNAFVSPALQYIEIAENRSLYETRYKAHQQLRAETVRILINDTVNSKPARVPLDAAIDHLEPCNWAFEENLRIVLGAIGGHLHPARPLVWCDRNLHLRPDRQELLAIAEALIIWSGVDSSSKLLNTELSPFSDLISTLGAPASLKQWLAASLGKTITVQLA